MNFLADECCDAGLVRKLRNEGYDVFYVMEHGRGTTDTEILEKAFTEKRVLITEDKDFGELVYRLKRQVYGVILLRFSTSERDRKWPCLKELLYNKGITLPGHFVVIDAEKFRIRPLQNREREDNDQ